MGSNQRARLACEARSLGAAAIRGHLYDFGRYPGLIDAGDQGELVIGELIELRDPDQTFQWLDAYEGIQPGLDSGNEYSREERAVMLHSPFDGAASRKLIAWVYIYAGDVSRARLVPSGRWGE